MYKEHRRGWDKLSGPILEACKQLGIDVLQIKEKYGGLRIYLGPAPDWLHDWCDQIEKLSLHVCEVCGEEGKLKGDLWFKTTCEKEECNK